MLSRKIILLSIHNNLFSRENSTNYVEHILSCYEEVQQFQKIKYWRLSLNVFFQFLAVKIIILNNFFVIDF